MNNILNKPPAISEDTLQYTIYPPQGSSDRASVTAIAVAIQSFVDYVLQGFVWHRDPFELKVVQNLESKEWMLEGHMRVGDSVDDEWCTVYLLREMSAKWDLVISVRDSDGEFLLIEAADYLPSWVSPSNSENRVWIYKSHIHLIDLSHISPPSNKKTHRRLPGSKESDGEDAISLDAEGFLSIQDGLRLVRDSSTYTAAPAEVERAIWERLSGYPTALKQHIHVTKADLPLDVARALSSDPSLVQKAVETFYTRDALQLRAARKMSRFPPQPSVLRTVKMTRTAYAQLVGQKFYPPKIFGQWHENEGSNEWRWRDVGMKIACGFEMLFQESKNRSDASQTTIEGIHSVRDAQKDALRRHPDYAKYIQSLVFAGYFQGELEGSQLWTSLEDKAAQIFLQTRRQDDTSRASFASLVTTALLQAGTEAVQPSRDTEDPDEWLNIDSQSFDDMLEKKMGAPKTDVPINPDAMDVDLSEGELAKERKAEIEQASKLHDLAKKVETFLEGKGGIEGAEFEDEQSSGDEMDEFSDEKFSDDDSDDPDDDDDQDDGAAKLARREAMDKLVPGIDPSEYGKMPISFRNNSQRVAPTTVSTDTIGGAEDDGQVQQKPVRAPILMRDRYEGVDSDDETDEEDEIDEEEEEDQPQVVGEIEVDMEEEEDEFLEFSRQALGISDEQWTEIISERKNRGAFVPSHIKTESHSAGKAPNSSATEANTSEQRLREPQPGPRPNANPNLDSFEAVMQAMDAELARSRSQKSQGVPNSVPSADKGKGKANATTADDDADIETVMDAELQAALEQGEEDKDIDLDAEGGMDYNLIKNFLESFKSQGGLSGPVSSLAGRLQPGWSLPRDES
ncbi:hypothetical protein HETIRDRAFT_469700 [Heterobasidion irregulare TC 32-1]|uniref:SGT1-domain-containing protein n=1 Tax=Heterobasidion irregulare (strain TC 32-1) TaxID=747525 RepID=W4KPD2_HETIT|nr:uncharacterized protein HETIRDRAFT_469700 [Heterobasidion irregulare TC 32-1]ETW87564.1 hypothetical protein HETIRDRAFT_469700 [Heterobasidion irregulare TC 32-1]